MNSDSSARADTSRSEQRTPSRLTTPARDGFVRRLPRTPPRNARVNQIGASSPNSPGTSGSNSGASGTGSGASDGTDPREYHDYDTGVPGDEAPQPFTNMDEACINLIQIDVPDTESTPNNLLAFDRYRRAVHAIREDTNSAYKQNCIVCQGQHRFENCTMLNDHNFLKQHYIWF